MIIMYSLLQCRIEYGLLWAQVTEQTLHSLLAVGGTSREDILKDPDFYAAQDQEWFKDCALCQKRSRTSRC